MTIKPAVTLCAMILLITGCQKMKIASEQDPDFDFTTAKSYQWADAPHDILNKADTYIHDDIRAALDQQLILAGLRKAEDDADLHMVYYVKLREETEYTETANPDQREFSGGLVYNRDASGWQYAEREPDLNVYTVEIGTLTVLMFDAATGDRIWRGTLQTEIDRSQPSEKQKAKIHEAAVKLLSRLPALGSS